jgi:hypothetical protein
MYVSSYYSDAGGCGWSVVTDLYYTYILCMCPHTTAMRVDAGGAWSQIYTTHIYYICVLILQRCGSMRVAEVETEV